MSKVLLVEVDADEREALARALACAGHEVSVAASGSSALAALDRDRPDLVVAEAWLGDMHAGDLAARARRQGAAGVPFLVLAGVDAARAASVAHAGVEMVCSGHVSIGALLDRVNEILARTAGPIVAPPTETGPIVPMTASEGVAPTFEGSLGVMDLPALAQAIGMGGKTGRLDLSVSGGDGMVEFHRGWPVHAEFAGGQGEAAFAALVWASQADAAGAFRFSPAARTDLPPGRRTIHRSVEGLLLDVAAWLDEASVGSRAAAMSGAR